MIVNIKFRKRNSNNELEIVVLQRSNIIFILSSLLQLQVIF